MRVRCNDSRCRELLQEDQELRRGLATSTSTLEYQRQPLFTPPPAGNTTRRRRDETTQTPGNINGCAADGAPALRAGEARRRQRGNPRPTSPPDLLFLM
jgi:hypothetical protein